MIDNLKKILNEDQDPKAIEKITEKLLDLLMKSEEVGYIGVQKKPALNVFPDSVVLTDKRVIICKPKNLGLSMGFTDYDWETIVAPMVKENLLGSEFSFVTKTDATITIDYLPKNQAKKLYTFAKEQLELRKNLLTKAIDNLAESVQAEVIVEKSNFLEEAELIKVEDVKEFSDFLDEPRKLMESSNFKTEAPEIIFDKEEKEIENKTLSQFSKDELFEKLQNYKKLLDNGLIHQSEYDSLKNEVLKYI